MISLLEDGALMERGRSVAERSGPKRKAVFESCQGVKLKNPMTGLLGAEGIPLIGPSAGDMSIVAKSVCRNLARSIYVELYVAAGPSTVLCPKILRSTVLYCT